MPVAARSTNLDITKVFHAILYGIFIEILFKKNYGSFLWRGPTTFCKNVKKGNYLMATEPLHEGNLLFTTKFPEIPGNLIKLGSRKG